MSDTDPAHPPAALFSVVKGVPTDEELAALVVVLSAGRTPPPAPTPTASGGGWSSYARSIRTPLHPGPGVWRSSGRT